MIPQYQEPRGLHRDTPAMECDYPLVSREAAVEGSAMLRDAILRAKGHLVPVIRPWPRISRAIPAPHRPKCCETCGSPLRPVSGMISHIQAAVCGYYGLHPSSMVSSRRGKDISHPRQIAMFLASELTPKSLPDIGRRFGGRDHTTVIHAIRAVKARIKADPEIAEDVRILRTILAPETAA